MTNDPKTKPKTLHFTIRPHDVSAIISALLHRAEVLGAMYDLTPPSPERESYASLTSLYESLADQFARQLTALDADHLAPANPSNPQ